MTAARGVLPGLFAVLGIVLLAGLGIWQLERRAWKLQLIDRVERRVHTAVTQAPGPDRWRYISAASDEYRHVELNGVYLPDGQVLVQALTRLGGGYWVMTALQTAAGSIVLVNRGFVPSELGHQPSQFEPAHGAVRVTGLLRMSEPRGRLFSHNNPAEQRWYSRDVAAIADAGKLEGVAPYFIDADSDTAAYGTVGNTYPIGGLTVITFPNNHLVYALTWFGLSALGALTLVAGQRQLRQHVVV